MNRQIRLMIVDDHPVVRQGLTAMIGIEADLKVVAEAERGEDAIALFRRHQPDVTLIDLRLPGISGFETIEAIRREFPTSRFLVLTTYNGHEDIYRALQAGAQGYLLKGAFREVIIESIRAVGRGLRRIPAEIQTRLDARAGEHGLTPREHEILRLLAEGKTNKEIAAQLAIGDGTVKWFVKNILGKLGVGDRTRAVTIALQRGIIHLD